MDYKEIILMEPGIALSALVAEKLDLPCKDYSTDKNLVWDIVEEFAKKNYTVKVIANGEEYYICTIFSDKVYSSEIAKTMPEAICKAAILTTLEER